MKKLFTGLVFLFISSATMAQSHGISPYWQTTPVPIPKEGISASGNIGNSLAIKSSGEMYLFFNDSLSTGGYKLNYSTSSDNGQTWSAVTQLPPTLSQGGITVSAAADQNDNIHVIWLSDFANGAKVYYSRLDNGSSSWTTATLISDNIVNYANAPVITADRKNRIHIVWNDGNDDEEGVVAEIGYRRSADGGLSWDATKTLSTVDGLHSSFARIDFIGAGDTLAIPWRNEVTPDGSWDVKGAFSTDGGVTWVEKLISGKADTEWDPMIAIDRNGNIHIGIMEYPENHPTDVFVWYQRSSDVGNSWSLVDTIYSNRSKFPFLTYDYDRDIIWYYFRTDTNLTTYPYNISDFAGRYSVNAGYTWSDVEYGTDFWVHPTSSDAKYNNVIVDKNGLVHAYYSLVDNTSSVGETTIHYQHRSEVPSVTYSAYVQIDPISCKGVTDAVATAVPQGGVQPYTYKWNNGATTKSISGLKAGTYNVKIKDANGALLSVNGVVAAATDIAPTSSITNVSCSGDNDGAIDLSVSGGTSPYTYSWSNGLTAEDISKLTTGSYTVTITDAHACQKSYTTTLTEPAAISITGTVSTICNYGETASIDVSVSGGTSPYTYSWGNGATTQDVSGVSVGTQVITVLDANGCKDVAAFTVSSPNPISISGTKTDVSCNAGSNGSIDITVSGGSAPFSYAWTNGASTQDVSGLSSGLHTVTVTDANACQATKSVTLSQPNSITISSYPTDVSCYDGNNGSINVSVYGGTTPYSYSWSNGSKTEDLSALVAGSYTVTVKDANLCQNSSTVTVNQSSQLTYSGTITNITCFGQTNGSITLTASGGSTPYSYAWSNGATTKTVNNLSKGSYSFTITDNKGCSTSGSLSITEPTQLTVSGTVTDVKCYGDNNGSIDASVSGGTSPYTYSWSNSSTSQDLIGLSAKGSYILTVTDAKNCKSSSAFTLTVPNQLLLSGSVTNESCKTNTKGAVNLTVSGGTSPYTYSWSNGSTAEDLSNLTAASYSVTVKDKNVCSKTASYTVSTTDPFKVNATTTNPTCSSCKDGKITLSVLNGNSPYTYLWSTGSTSKSVMGLGIGTYSVTIADVNGCSMYKSYTLSSSNKAISNISNANTSEKSITIFPNPASDYINIQLMNYENEQVDMKLFNSLGQVVYNNVTYIENNTWSKSIDITKFLSGVYYVYISSSNSVPIKYSVVIK